MNEKVKQMHGEKKLYVKEVTHTLLDALLTNANNFSFSKKLDGADIFLFIESLLFLASSFSYEVAERKIQEDMKTNKDKKEKQLKKFEENLKDLLKEALANNNKLHDIEKFYILFEVVTTIFSNYSSLILTSYFIDKKENQKEV
ncbi:MAG: hypothetical protein N2043_01540 [Ignavibacterium sp.]|nr:hypothetical protein [Ignavibacterium sp.]